MKKTKFSFSMPIVKAFINKATGKKTIEGVASTTDKDLHGDKMSPDAIKSMADSLKSLKKKSGTLNAEHDKSWMSELGDVTDLSVSKDNELVMRAELDDSPLSDTLWYKLTEKKKKLGLSIGGFVKSYRIIVDEKTQEYMRVFEDVVLDHIAVVSQPANPNTWVSAISKSLNVKGEERVETEESEVEKNAETEIESSSEETESSVEKTEESETTESDEKVEEGEKKEIVEETEEVSTETPSATENEKEKEVEDEKTEVNEEASEGSDSTEDESTESDEKTTEEVPEDSKTEEVQTSTEEAPEEDTTKDESGVTKADFDAFKSEVLSLIESLVPKKPEESTEKSETTVAETKVEDEGEGIEVLKKEIIALKSEVDMLVTKRKTIAVSKSEDDEQDGDEEFSKEALEKALADVDREFKGNPERIFVERGLLRKKFSEHGIK